MASLPRVRRPTMVIDLRTHVRAPILSRGRGARARGLQPQSGGQSRVAEASQVFAGHDVEEQSLQSDQLRAEQHRARRRRPLRERDKDRWFTFRNTAELMAFPSPYGMSSPLGRSIPSWVSWAWPFGGENPCLWGLDKLGFPWIPSSETRLINGLRGIFGEKVFRGVSPRPRSRNGRVRSRSFGRAGLFMAQAYSISDCQQSFVVRPRRGAKRAFHHGGRRYSAPRS